MKKQLLTHQHLCILNVVFTVTVCFVLSVFAPGQSVAIRPGTIETQPTEETFPDIPGKRPERPFPGQPGDRAIVEQPQPTQQLQKRWADAYLPNSVVNVTDPQDGLSKDGRVAVFEGMNAQVVYRFYSEHKVLNVPNQPDLTVYTFGKTGFEGPYSVFVANFGDSTWIPLSADVSGISSFDLPPTLESIELILITNRHPGATYIEAIEGITSSNGALQGTFSYLPEELIGLRAERLDAAEVERARMLLTGGMQGYQLAPLGEIEVKWRSPIQNLWKTEEFLIEADGDYEVFASDSRGMDTFIGRKAGSQAIDLPQNITEAARVRIRNPNSNRPVIIYIIIGRR